MPVARITSHLNEPVEVIALSDAEFVLKSIKNLKISRRWLIKVSEMLVAKVRRMYEPLVMVDN